MSDKQCTSGIPVLIEKRVASKGGGSSLVSHREEMKESK